MYLFIYSLVNLFIIAVRVDNYTHAQIEKAPPKKKKSVRRFLFT